MNMQKEVKTELLPTAYHDKFGIIKDDSTGMLGTCIWSLGNAAKGTETALNLYIIDAECKITEGKWFIANQGARKCARVDNGKYPFIEIENGRESGHFYTCSGCIIASTDPKLIGDGILPISNEFLSKFATAQGNGKVMIELEQKSNCCNYPIEALNKYDGKCSSCNKDVVGDGDEHFLQHLDYKTDKLGYAILTIK